MNKYIEYIINNILNEARVQRTIDKKLWLTVSSTISRNKSSEAEFIKPIGNDKDNLLQRYVAALLITKKECPQSEDDIEKLKTYKLVGQKYLELGGTIQDIVNLYNLNKFGNTDNTNNTDNQIINNDQTETTNQDVVQSSNTSSDLFSDFYDDEDKYNIYGEDMLNDLLKLDKDAKLDTVIMELLHITKPAGYKLVKPENDYQRYERVSSSTYNPSKYDAYTRKLYNIIIANNWIPIFTHSDDTSFNIINEAYRYINSQGFFYEFKNIIDFKDRIGTYIKNRFTVDETKNEYLEKLNNFVSKYNKLDDYYKQIIQNNNFLLTDIYTSPDKGLIYYLGYFKNEVKNNFQIIISKSIITFTGTNFYEDIFKSKNKKSTKQQIKNNKKLQKLYIEFIHKYARLRLTANNWIFKVDENNSPTLEGLRIPEWVQYSIKNWTPIYFSILTENIYKGSEIELISRYQGPLILVRFIKLDKPINGYDYKAIIELTELGEKDFKTFCKENS